MTARPDLAGSLIALAVALILGVGFAQLWPRQARQARVIRHEQHFS